MGDKSSSFDMLISSRTLDVRTIVAFRARVGFTTQRTKDPRTLQSSYCASILHKQSRPQSPSLGGISAILTANFPEEDFWPGILPVGPSSARNRQRALVCGFQTYHARLLHCDEVKIPCRAEKAPNKTVCGKKRWSEAGLTWHCEELRRESFLFSTHHRVRP